MITLGILSYNSPKTLKNTLKSCEFSGILNKFDELLCVIQPSSLSDQELQICKNYNISPLLEEKNTKMAGAIKKIWENTKNNYVLFLECDFVICENEKKISKILNFGLKQLFDESVDLIRLRSLKNPGHPIQHNLVKKDHEDKNWHLNPELLRQANYITNYSDEPDKIYPQYVSKYSDDPKTYLMSSKNCVYTNNPYITSRKFYSSYILPHIEDGGILEDKIDRVWHHHDHKILITEGIFKHNRLDGHVNCGCCPIEYGGNGRCDSFKCCPDGKITGVKPFDPKDILDD